MQPVRERARAAVADKIGDQLIGFAAEAIAVVVDAKLDAQHFTRHRRHIVNNDAFLRIRDHRDGNIRPADLTIRHAAKGVRSHARQRRQRLVAVDHRFHQIGGVPAIAEGVQRIKHRAAGLIAERLEVATGEVGRRVSRVDGLRADLGHAHPVSRPGHRQLGVDRVTFAVGIFFIQQRRGDGVGQAIYGPVQRIIFHFKIKRGAVGRGTGVMAAAVQLKKLCKAVRLGIFLRPHQRHMFQKMRQPLMICRILQGSHRHHQRRQRFHRLRIGNQQHDHVVIKADRLILTRIFFAFADRLLNRLPSGVGLTKRRPEGGQHNKNLEP